MPLINLNKINLSIFSIMETSTFYGILNSYKNTHKTPFYLILITRKVLILKNYLLLDTVYVEYQE